MTIQTVTDAIRYVGWMDNNIGHSLKTNTPSSLWE